MKEKVLIAAKETNVDDGLAAVFIKNVMHFLVDNVFSPYSRHSSLP